MDGGGARYAPDTNGLDGPTELAQAQAQAGTGEAVGRIETANGQATVTRTDGTKVKAAAGLEIFQGDVVETAGKSSVGIVFADNSTFSLADEGEMTIDEMVYDPGSQEGEAAISVAQGVFTFVSGQIAKTGVDAMLINTPTSTIGIRGTSLAGNISAKSGGTFTLLKDQDAPAAGKTIKGQAGDDLLLTPAPDPVLLAQAGGSPPSGEVTIRNNVGTQVLNQINATTQVSSPFSPPSRPIILPQAIVNRVYAAAVQAMQQTLATVSGGQAGATTGGDEPTGDDNQTGEEGTQEGGTEEGADPEAQAVAEAAVEAFEQALANGEPLGAALNAAIDEAATEIAGQEIISIGVIDTPGGIDDIFGDLLDPGVGGFFGDGGGPGSGGGDDGISDVVGEFVDFGPGEEFLDDLFLDIFFDVFEDVLEDFEEFIEEEVDRFVEDFEDQIADVTVEFPLSTLDISEGIYLGDLTDDQNDQFINDVGGNVELQVTGGSEAGDLFIGGSNNNTITFNTDNVDHVFRVEDVERVNMSQVGSGGSFNLNMVNAGNLTISLSPTGDLNIAGTAADGADLDLDQHFTLISDGSIGSSGQTLEISGSSGSDTLTLDSGTHTIEGMTGIEYFHIGAAVTTVNSQLSGVTVQASSGSSLSLDSVGNTITISSSSTLTTLAGNSGQDIVTVSSGATVTNIADVESITGSSATLIGLDNGGVTVTSLGGSMTTFTGGTGDDTVTTSSLTATTFLGGSGTDTVTLGGSSNTISSLGGVETLDGGSGTDSVTLNTSITSLVVTGDIETLTGSGSTETLTFDDNGVNLSNVSAIATITGGTGADSVSFTDANQTTTLSGVESITGGTGDDTLTIGGSTAANVSAGDGADHIAGGTGGDIIDGGTGADTLVGRAGTDQLTGGTGADRFVFSGATPSGLGTDTVTDFSGATAFGGGSGESDVFVLDTSDLGINSIVYEEVSWDGSTTTINLSNANATVIVLFSAAGSLTNAITALVAGNAAGDSTSGEAVILFNNSGSSNQLQMVHTDDAASGSANLNTLATVSNNTSAADTEDLAAADFAVTA